MPFGRRIDLVWLRKRGVRQVRLDVFVGGFRRDPARSAARGLRNALTAFARRCGVTLGACADAVGAGRRVRRSHR